MRAILSGLALAAALTACAQSSPVLQNTAPPAHAFTLTDQDGKRYSVGRGGEEAAALFFGYTHCQDVCPKTLALLGRARAWAGITPKQLRIVMVSVDPARDDPKALRAFISREGVAAFALTGSRRQLQAVYRDYGVVVQTQKRGAVGHTDYIYLIDSAGRLRALVSPETAMDVVAKDLKRIVD